MVDRYTKVVLTVIAACLLWLCLWGPAPKWGAPAEASGVYDSYRKGYESKMREIESMMPPAPAKIEGKVEGQPYGTPLRVDIVAVGGKELQMGLLTSFSGMSSLSGLPVEVRAVEMKGTVPVDVNGPVEVEGTVNVR